MKPYKCTKCGIKHYRGQIYIDHLDFQKPTTPKKLKANKSLKANYTQTEVFALKFRFMRLGITNTSQLIRNAVERHLNYLEGGDEGYKEIIAKIDSFTAEAVAVLRTPAPRLTSQESEAEWKQARVNNALIKAQTMTNEHANFRKIIIPELHELFKIEDKGLVKIGSFDHELTFIKVND